MTVSNNCINTFACVDLCQIAHFLFSVFLLQDCPLCHNKSFRNWNKEMGKKNKHRKLLFLQRRSVQGVRSCSPSFVFKQGHDERHTGVFILFELDLWPPVIPIKPLLVNIKVFGFWFCCNCTSNHFTLLQRWPSVSVFTCVWHLFWWAIVILIGFLVRNTVKLV